MQLNTSSPCYPTTQKWNEKARRIQDRLLSSVTDLRRCGQIDGGDSAPHRREQEAPGAAAALLAITAGASTGQSSEMPAQSWATATRLLGGKDKAATTERSTAETPTLWPCPNSSPSQSHLTACAVELLNTNWPSQSYTFHAALKTSTKLRYFRQVYKVCN